MSYVQHVFERDEVERLYRCEPPSLGGSRWPGECSGCGHEVTDESLEALPKLTRTFALTSPRNVGMSLLIARGDLP